MFLSILVGIGIDRVSLSVFTCMNKQVILRSKICRLYLNRIGHYTRIEYSVDLNVCTQVVTRVILTKFWYGTLITGSRLFLTFVKIMRYMFFINNLFQLQYFKCLFTSCHQKLLCWFYKRLQYNRVSQYIGPKRLKEGLIETEDI